MTLLLLSNCKVVLPSWKSWCYAVTVHVACCIVGALPLGTLLYHLQMRHTSPLVRRVLSVLIGLGTATAVSLGTPLFHLDNDSPARWMGPFLASTFGFATFFKTMNWGFGQYPTGADVNLKTWLMWFVIMPEPEFTKGKLVIANRQETVQRIRDFLYKIAGLFVILTFLVHSPNYRVHFGEQVPEWLSTLLNGFIHIWLLYLFAAFCMDFSAVFNMPTTGGIRLKAGFDDPLLQSRSLSEAWGVRWNLPVQVLLKRTIYVPARKQGFSRFSSAMFTFVGSGLLHEYNFHIHNRVAYQPGFATIFFVGMGLLMLLGSWLWDQLPQSAQRMIEQVPSPLISALLTMSAAWPFERFFIQSWLNSGFAEAGAELLPHLNCKRW